MRLVWASGKKSYHYLDEVFEEDTLLVGWHGELFTLPMIYRKLSGKGKKFGVVSQHHDGDMIAKVLSMLHIHTIRGSSRKGARGVVINSIKELKKNNSVFFTPDGPKGPRYSIGDGVVALSKKFRLPIIIVTVTPKRYWQFNSWDKFVVPKLFSKIDIYYQVVHLYDMEMEEAKGYLRERMVEYALK
jgi:lysophospholipid acyltransferase (LPLAT)-like uncharacterized protein